MAVFGQRQNAPQLASAYEHLTSNDEDAHAFDSWQAYKDLRAKFHYIRRSELWPGLLANLPILSLIKLFHRLLLLQLLDGPEAEAMQACGLHHVQEGP
jgi:membrane protein required for beta-lactamase induction